MSNTRNLHEPGRVEEALRKSEQQYRTLAENIPFVIARFDKALRHTYINEYGVGIYGISKEEVIGKTYADLSMQKDKAANFMQSLQEVFATGRPRTLDSEYASPSFGHRYFSSSLVPENNEAGRLVSVLVITRENTARRRAALEREEANRHLQALLQVIEIAAAQLEPHQAAQKALEYLARNHDFDITNVWLAAEDSLELVACTNFAGSYRLHSPMSFSAPYNSPQVYFSGTPVFIPDAGEGNPAVCEWHDKMGVQLGAYAVLPLRSRGQIIGTLNFAWHKPRSISSQETDYYTSIGNALGVIFDNVRLYEAEKKRTEELEELHRNLEKLVDEKTGELQAVNVLLRQSEQQYREIIEVSPDAYIVLADNRVVYANPSAVKLMGSGKNGKIDSGFLANIAAHEKYNEIAALLAGAEGPHQSVRLGEIKIPQKANLPPMIVDVTVVRVIFEGEKALQFIVRDITERKEMEKEMARLDRLEIVGEMAAGIGHEVRNPMTSVRGFLQLMSNKESDPEKTEYYGIMIEELDRANSIITEFLALAKDRAVKLKPVSLNCIINSLYPLLAADATKQDKFIILKKSDTPIIPLNEKEVRQLIINLARNGLEAMNAGGCLKLGTYIENEEIILFVEDEGCGIKSEVYDKLGTPFVTTKETGTGLGLAVCYSIANKHKAKIDVKTGAGGTTFYVRFNREQKAVQ